MSGTRQHPRLDRRAGDQTNPPDMDVRNSVVHRVLVALRPIHFEYYGLAVLSVAFALGAALLLQRFHFRDAAVLLLLFAGAISSWYGGIGPAVLAVLLSLLGFNYFFVPPIYTLRITPSDLPYFIIFASFTSLISWFAAIQKRSEKELRQVVDSIPAMVWSGLPDGSNVRMNSRWTEYTGLPAGGFGWQAAVHPQDLAEHMDAFRASSATGQPFEDEVRFRGADGRYRWFLVQGMPVRDQEGNILKWYGIVTDIEDRKRAEEALIRNEAYLAEAQKLSRTGSFAYNPGTRTTVFWSEELFRIFRLDPQDGIPSYDETRLLVHPDDRARVSQECLQGFREKREFSQTYRLLLRDGAVRHIHAVWHPVLDKTGELVEYVGTAADVTDREQAEQALRRSEAYLADAQRLTHTGSWARDAITGEQLYWSEEMFRIFGFDPQQGLPTRAQGLERIHPEDRDLVKRQASDMTLLHKEPFQTECRLVLPDGTVKHVQGVGHPVFSPQGEVVEVVGAVVDITWRKRADLERERLRHLEAQLARLNRVSTMGELAASLAHEIKQPIAAAVTNAEACLRILEPEQPDLPDARDAASGMVGCAKRAAEIIDRVRALFTKNAAQHEAMDVNQVIRDIVVLIENEARKPSVAFHLELAENLPRVMGDHVQLQQVMLNLLVNGIEAMDTTGGELRITSQAREKEVLISVTDTGIGLPAEKADQLFDAFFTTKPQGTGMGLAISRSILEAHGGHLWATPNSGRGATFHFTLPCNAQGGT